MCWGSLYSRNILYFVSYITNIFSQTLIFLSAWFMVSFILQKILTFR